MGIGVRGKDVWRYASAHHLNETAHMLDVRAETTELASFGNAGVDDGDDVDAMIYV